VRFSNLQLPIERLRKGSTFRKRFLLVALATALWTSNAAGQDTALFIRRPPPRTVFVSANVGFLVQSQDFTQRAEFPLYDEVGSFEAQHAIKGGPAFDIAGGVRLRGGFAIGLAYSRRATHARDVTVTAQVPDPLFTNRLRTATGTLTGLEHDERAVHVQALLHVPVTIEFDVTLSGGPTFFIVEDELVESITPIERAGGSVELGIRRFGQRQTAAGFHVGIDTTYMFTRHAGAGAMLRYSRGSADLVLPSQSVESDGTLNPGGLEFTVGLRLRF
jgi:hypothetical protein